MKDWKVTELNSKFEHSGRQKVVFNPGIGVDKRVGLRERWGLLSKS